MKAMCLSEETYTGQHDADPICLCHIVWFLDVVVGVYHHTPDSVPHDCGLQSFKDGIHRRHHAICLIYKAKMLSNKVFPYLKFLWFHAGCWSSEERFAHKLGDKFCDVDSWFILKAGHSKLPSL